MKSVGKSFIRSGKLGDVRDGGEDVRRGRNVLAGQEIHLNSLRPNGDGPPNGMGIVVYDKGAGGVNLRMTEKAEINYRPFFGAVYQVGAVEAVEIGVDCAPVRALRRCPESLPDAVCRT